MPANSAPETSFSTTILVDQTPAEAYAAINNVRGWWSEDIDGPTDTEGGEFTYHNDPTHRCTIRVWELVPGARVVWIVVDNVFDFTEDETEWNDTEVRFDIVPRGDETEIRFSHIGLVPDYECFDVCSGAWDFYINTSLRGLIRTGEGLPNLKERQGSAASDHA
jgi:hypothetical protein